MDEPTLTALEDSIQKWEDIVAGDKIDMGWGDCALCDEFLRRCCEGCPVAEHVDREGCRDTPYIDFCIIEEQAARVLNLRVSTFSINEVHEYDPDRAQAMRQAAQEELDFLKSLLPAE